MASATIRTSGVSTVCKRAIACTYDSVLVLARDNKGQTIIALSHSMKSHLNRHIHHLLPHRRGYVCKCFAGWQGEICDEKVTAKAAPESDCSPLRLTFSFAQMISKAFLTGARADTCPLIT